MMPNDYAWPLRAGFPPGSRVKVKAIPEEGDVHSSFDVNLVTKLPCEGIRDIAYHVALRYGGEYIVNNSYLVGKDWQQEERHYNSPVAGGKECDITILCERDHFTLFINGKHFSNFVHRMPVERIKCLTVTGSVSVTSISVDKVKAYDWPVPDGFLPGHIANIRGAVDRNSVSGQFDVDFRNGASLEEDHDVPYRLTVRFDDGIAESNSYQVMYGWGPKETQPMQALKRGDEFHIAVTFTGTHFEVTVNEKDSLKFKKRFKPKKITQVVVRDGASVSSITVVVPMVDESHA